MAAAATDRASRPADAHRLKSSRKAWTSAEKQEVRRIIAECQDHGLPLSEAFRKVAQALPHRSPTAVAMLYYNVLRRERKNGRPADARPAAPATARPLQVTGDLVEAFEGLPEYIARLHHRLDEMDARLAAMPEASLDSLARWFGAVASALEQAGQLEARLGQIDAERQALARANEQLRQQLDAMRRRLDEIEAAYREARDLYEMFTSMASISQIMSLGDFKQRMKTTLDRWGNVLKVEFEPLHPAPSALQAVRPPSPAPVAAQPGGGDPSSFARPAAPAEPQAEAEAAGTETKAASGGASAQRAQDM